MSIARVLVPLFSAAASLLFADVARAEEPTDGAHAREDVHAAIVFAKREDAIVTRLRHELSGLGLEPAVIVADAPCSDPRVSREMMARSTTIVLCVDDDGITPWGLDGSSATPRERVSWSESPPSPADLAIVQVTEDVRAQALAQHAEAGDRAFVTSIAPEIDRLRPPPYVRPPDETARATLRAGIGLFGDVGVGEPPLTTAELAVEARIHRRVLIAVTGLLPLSSSRESDLADIRAGAFEVGALVPLTMPTSRFIPKLGVSTGVVALYANPLEHVGRDETLFSPLVAANASLSLRLYGPVRLAVGGQMGAMLSQMVVRVDGDQYRFGWSFYSLTSALEVQIL
jgi:hypothetical protein